MSIKQFLHQKQTPRQRVEAIRKIAETFNPFPIVNDSGDIITADREQVELEKYLQHIDKLRVEMEDAENEQEK